MHLETTADAACEILKDKFQYVSDQLELNSKQHQAVKGRFVSFLQEHVAISTRLVTIFTGESTSAEILVFVWFCLNRINGQRGMVCRRAE